MIRELVHVKLSKEYKNEVFQLVDETIEKVAKEHNVELAEKEKRKIKNLCFDQVNIHISGRARAKTFWVFDAEECLPLIIERERSQKPFNSNNSNVVRTGSFKMKPNLTWTFNEKNNKCGGVTQEKFNEKVLKMLKEDFETAAFYGALSFVTEGDYNEDWWKDRGESNV